MRNIERSCGLGQERCLGGPGTCDDQLEVWEKHDEGNGDKEGDKFSKANQ